MLDFRSILDSLRRELVIADTIPNIRAVRDRAAAHRVLARGAREDFDLQFQLAEIVIRAERKAGRLLHDEHLRGGNHRSGPNGDQSKLRKVGVTKSESFAWQLEASYPDDDFEHHVQQCKIQRKMLSSAKLIRLAKAMADSNGAEPRQPSPLSALALELTRFICRGQRYGCILAAPPWPSETANTPGTPLNWGSAAGMLRELCELPVADIAAKNSQLHLLASADHLADAIHLLESWGFVSRGLLMLTTKIRFSDNWPVEFDFLLLGVRGNPKFRNVGISRDSIDRRIDASTRWRQLCALIESVSPAPRLQLFGIESPDGWTVLRASAING